MFDTISIGSSLVDVYIFSDEFSLEHRQDGVYLCEKYGSKIEIDGFELRVGGGGANTAVSFSRLGFRAGVVSELGTDVAAEIIAHGLRLEKVGDSLLIKEKLEKTGGSVIMVGIDGGRTVMVSRGAASLLDPRDIPQTVLRQSRWIHLSSIGGRLGTLSAIFEAVPQMDTAGVSELFPKTPSRGVAGALSWNPGKAELLLLSEGRIRIADIPCSIFSVNRQEWELLAAIQTEILSDCPEVLVTDGKKGGLLYLDGVPESYQAVSLAAVDETGAGDSFISSYVAARLHSHSPQVAVKWGLANAASVVGQIGAQPGLLSRSVLETQSQM